MGKIFAGSRLDSEMIPGGGRARRGRGDGAAVGAPVGPVL